MKQLIRFKIVFIFFMLLILSSFSLYKSIEFKEEPFNVEEALNKKINQAYLEEKITIALNEDKIEEAQNYVDLANYLNIHIANSILKRLEKENGFWEKSIRGTKSFFEGFLNGSSQNSLETAGSITADMTLYGDIRDFKKETTHYVNEEPYDSVILTLSAIGIGLTISQVISIGSSTPLKVGNSLLKATHKSKNISPQFQEILKNRLSKTINLKNLKNLKFNSLKSIDKSSKKIAKNINLKPIEGIFSKIYKIKKETSTADTIFLLKYVDNTKDLKKITNISKKYKKQTKAIMTIFGKRVLRGTKKVIVLTKELFLQLFALISSIIGFIFSLRFIRLIPLVK